MSSDKAVRLNVCFDKWDGVFAVPSSLADENLRLAGALQLKTALWVFRHNSRHFCAEEIAEALNVPKGDVSDALQYWIELGYFRQTDSEDKQELHPSPFFDERADVRAAETKTENEKQEKQPENKPQAQPRKTAQRLSKPTGTMVTDRIAESPDISFLMQEAQRILGRTISPALVSTLIAIYDDYGLPADVISMLLMYTKGIGKANTHYIEAVARGWAEEEIDTHEKAEEKLRQLSTLNSAWRKIVGVIDIPYRPPVSRELPYIDNWVIKWKFSMDMIREAYERCIEATNKLSMPYMNKILERWFKNGIKTPEMAAEEQTRRSKAKAANDEAQRSFDYDELENFDFTNEEGN